MFLLFFDCSQLPDPSMSVHDNGLQKGADPSCAIPESTDGPKEKIKLCNRSMN